MTQCRSLPSRSKKGCSFTCSTTYKSPAGPPNAPPSPSPLKRMRVPSSTPAGIFVQVGATLCAAAARRAPAKEISETKKVSEDVAEILEDGRVKTRRGASRAAHTRVAEAVIKGALLGIRENRVRLACFLELLL